MVYPGWQVRNLSCKFNFKSALTDLAVPLSKGYLINLRLMTEDQFYRIIDLTKNDEQALEELALQFNILY